MLLLPRCLQVSGNKLTSLAQVAPLTNLVTLGANSNALVHLDGLDYAKLTRLESLSLAANQLVDLPEEVRGLHSVRAGPGAYAVSLAH